MACNPTRLELSNSATTTVQVTIATDPGDGTAVTLQVDELSIDQSQTTSSGVATFTIAAVSAANNSIWDATIQVGSNSIAAASVQVVETNVAQTVGVTVSDADVTYCAPSGAAATTYPLVFGTSVIANTSTNGTVTFDEYWSGSPTLYGQQQWKKRNFGSYFRLIDTNGFTSSTTYNSTTIVWSSADPAVIEDLSQADFEGHIDLLFANWLTHCISKVNSQVSTYPDDYQSRMYIVADMEFSTVDANFAQQFSRVRLRLKDGATYDATSTPHSVYFGDGTASSPKSINAKGLYFLDKLEAWVDAMGAEFPWAAGRIMWYSLPQSLAANQLQAASGSSSTAAEAQAFYTDWLGKYDEITDFPVTQFESLVDRMGPHAPLYPPTFAVKPEYLIGYVQAIGAIDGTVMMDGNLQPNQAGSATLWDTWNAYTADDFTMSGYYQPTTANTRWRMPHGVIQYLQTKAVQAGANVQHFMAFVHDTLFFDDSVTDATLLAAVNLQWPTLDLSDTDAGTPGSDSSGDRWGRIRRSEMIYNNHQFDDFSATSLNDINDVDVPSPANGQVLGWNSTTERWEATSTSGTGTVTSVGLSMPTGFTVTGSPVTSSGTLGVTWDGNADTVTGPVLFTAKNRSGTTMTKGQVVFISGHSGTESEVDLADADDATAMPAFGLVNSTTANDNADVEIVTFGEIIGMDTSAFSVGDVVYVSTTPGELTATPPTGESSLIQNMGKVVRSHATEGIIKVIGAGRTNATPNLDQDKVFLGNASNQAVSTALSAIGLSKFNDDLPAVSDSYLMLIESPADKSGPGHVIDGRVAAARTIVSLYARTAAGSCTVTLNNVTSSPTQIATVGANTTGATDTSPTNTSVSENDRLAIAISSSSGTPEDLEIVVEYTQ